MVIANDTDFIQIEKVRIGNRMYNYGFNLTRGQNGNGVGAKVELDISSDFRKCAVPYNFTVVDVPSDLDNTLIFETDDNETYSVNGEYDSGAMRFNFKSPADELRVTYIRIGDKKSTEKLNVLNPTLTVYKLMETYFSYKSNMGTKGNVWTSFGCPNCDSPGSGSVLQGDLEAGNGICRVCHNTYPKKSKCTNCHKDGKCRSCQGTGVCSGVVGLN